MEEQKPYKVVHMDFDEDERKVFEQNCHKVVQKQQEQNIGEENLSESKLQMGKGIGFNKLLQKIKQKNLQGKSSPLKSQEQKSYSQHLQQNSENNFNYNFEEVQEDQNDDQNPNYIINNQQFSNQEELLEQYQYYTLPPSNRIDRSREKYSENNFSSSRNFTGKNVEDNFKRKICMNILEQTDGGKNTKLLFQLLSKQSDRLCVYVNEIAVWVSTYQIAFKIEDERRKRLMSEKEVCYRIQQCLVDYLNSNVSEKKYRFIKIAQGTFRACRIKKCTGDYWLRDFVRKFERNFSPKIDLYAIMGLKKNSKERNRIPKIYTDKKQTSIKPKQNNNLFPTDVQQRMISQIDQNIFTIVNNYLIGKSSQYNMDFNSLKKMYRLYGKFNIFQNFLHNNQNNGDGSSTKTLLFKKAEQDILTFIRNQDGCKRLKVYSFTCNLVNQLGINQFQDQQSFNKWFNSIIDRNCETIYDCVKLRNHQQSRYTFPKSNYTPSQ